MKQKLLIKIMALALCTAFVPVQAADVRQSDKADELIVTGDSFTPYENIPVAVLASDADKGSISALITAGGDISGKVIFTGTAVADANGEISYTIPLGTDVVKGVYPVYVAGEKYEVGFEKNADRINIVDEIAGAGASLATVLEAKYMYLSVDTELYKLCSGADAVAKVLQTELTKTPISSASENALEKLSAMLDKSILVVAANENKLTSLSQIETKLADAIYTKRVKLLMEQVTEQGKDAILASSQSAGYTTVDAMDTRYAKEVILKAISYPTVKTSTALLNVLNNYNAVLGLDLTAFNTLTEAKKAEAIVAFSGRFPSVGNMQATLDSIVTSYTSQTPPSAGGGGGGGGGGASGGGGGGGSFIAPTMPSASAGSQASQAQSSVFADLGSVSWAKDAILTLHAKGIISGYGNKEFAPNNNIKREEFIKLVVGAYYPDEKAGVARFDDVKSNAWYYDSLGVALSHGIISGISDTSFGTGMNITRQDMAVILYRVAGGKLAVKDAERKFADDDMIADYAKEAVYALRDAGIINGVSETDFAPAKSATRAETAVMLYRFMNSVNGGI